MALTRVGAEQAVNACAAKNLVLGMSHERRWAPPVVDMITKAQSGALGRLLQVEANFSHDKFVTLAAGNWRLNPAEAPVGGMTATGIHLTDMSTLLFGPARDVRVACEQLASNIPQGDTMSAHIRFTNGGSAYISARLAKLLTPTTTPSSAELVIEASGHDASVANVFEYAQENGRVSMVGLNIGRDITSKLGLLQLKNLTVRGCIGSPGVWPAAIRFLERTGIDLSPIQTHHFGLNDAAEAFELGKDAQACIRVTLSMKGLN